MKERDRMKGIEEWEEKEGIVGILEMKNVEKKKFPVKTYPKHRLTRPLSQTINRNSAAKPGFTAGFAVPT